jgi:hypothetical protein
VKVAPRARYDRGAGRKAGRPPGRPAWARPWSGRLRLGLAGDSEATATAVLVRDGEEHRITAFHTTLVARR